jgi:hypothetical protein
MATVVTAQTVEQLRSQSLTNLRGRRDGLDSNGYSVGAPDHRLPIDNLNTTVSSTLTAVGFSIFSCTAASSAAYTHAAPVPGTYKQLTQVSSSTLGYAINFGASVNIVTTAGSTFNQITFQGVGHTINLAAISTVTWVATNLGSGITFSTI